MSVFSIKNIQTEENQPEQFKHTVLLVDDEKSNLDVMKRLLEKSCNVLTALSGEEALAQLKKHKSQDISMIISDQRMPNMTGVQLFEKTIESHPKTLRLIVSGYSDMSNVISAINSAHIYHFIMKPFVPADFLMTVKQSLKTFDTIREKESLAMKLYVQLNTHKQALKIKEAALAKAQAKLSSLGVDPKSL